MINKIYEVVYDNPRCRQGIDYLTVTKEDVREQLKNSGVIVIGEKCYCNAECYGEAKKK